MKKVLLTILIILLCSLSIASAEIRTSHDDFSGMSLVISETLNVGQFNSVQLVKQTTQKENNDIYLAIKCQSDNPPYFQLKAAEIKIDDEIYTLSCLQVKAWPNNDGTVYTSSGYVIKDILAKKVLNANKISVRIYLYGDQAYETFNLTPEMLTEWKQIVRVVQS